MDLETENRLAAMLVEEARRLQAQADKEGVLAYLHRPNVRGRPNSRFLTATVLGVEQANRVVEVNELWRAREKEKELQSKLKRRVKDRELDDNDDKNFSNSSRSDYSLRHEQRCRSSDNPSSSKHDHGHREEDDGLRDDELEEFLRSRAKRGRGDIGPRMDEPGPYLSAPSKSVYSESETRVKEEWEHRIVGPQKPSCINSHEYIYPSDSSKEKHHTKEKERKKSKESSSERKRRKEEKKKKKSKHLRCHKKHGSRSDSE